MIWTLTAEAMTHLEIHQIFDAGDHLTSYDGTSHAVLPDHLTVIELRGVHIPASGIVHGHLGDWSYCWPNVRIDGTFARALSGRCEAHANLSITAPEWIQLLWIPTTRERPTK
jgi:hypothetical protein